MCPTRGRISSTFTRKVGLPWTCICSFCLLRQSSTYVARKDPTNPMLLATRKLCTARRRVRSNLVLTIVPESQKSYVPRNTVTCARSMGAPTRRTILAAAIVSRKTKRKNLISVPLRKAERNPFPQSSLLCNKARKWTRSGSVAVVIAIPTPNRELGQGA
jgi:hypothetical protein